MSQLTASNLIREPALHEVYWRPVATGEPFNNGGAGPSGGGGDRITHELRCNEVVLLKGARVGHAKFSFMVPTGGDQSIETALSKIGGDDHVRVLLHPMDMPALREAPGSESAEAEGEENAGVTIFDGVVSRAMPRIVRDGGTDDEFTAFTAVPLPVLDNQSPEHIITGRWAPGAEGESGVQVDLIETLDLPVVPNFRGRANRFASASNDDRFAFTAADSSYFADVWASGGDDDAGGEYWTVGQFLLSLIGYWLYGAPGSQRNRNIGVESATLEALATGSSEARFERLDDLCPPVKLLGLGILDAIEEVCDAAGFEFACEPDVEGETDRPYILRIGRKGAGREVNLLLPKRSAATGSVSALLDQANVSSLTLLRDNEAVRNEVIGVGRAFIEAAVQLKPLWDPNDIDLSTIDENLAGDAKTAAEDSTYHAKHVADGDEFKDFAHIGRMWGLAHRTGETFYTSGDYAQSDEGVDWVDLLGLDDEETSIQAARELLNPGAGAIKWSRRLRLPAALRRKIFVQRGEDLILQVSEEAGADGSWQKVPRHLFKPLRSHFGVLLTGIRNLAEINADVMRDYPDATCAVDDSWFKLIRDAITANLRFRLLCSIPADHAPVYHATRRSTSGCQWKRALFMSSGVEEIWSHPDFPVNFSGGWYRLGAGELAPGFGDGDTTGLIDEADRLQDKLEGRRISGSMQTWLMAPGKYRLLDRIAQVNGRELKLATHGESTTRAPSVVSITYKLAPGSQQGMKLALEDRVLEGVRS